VPEPAGPVRTGPAAAGRLRDALAARPVVLLTAGAALGSAAIAAVAVLLPAYLHQDGYSLSWAAAVTGGLGWPRSSDG
jgi:hypothetical protein